MREGGARVDAERLEVVDVERAPSRGAIEVGRGHVGVGVDDAGEHGDRGDEGEEQAAVSGPSPANDLRQRDDQDAENHELDERDAEAKVARAVRVLVDPKSLPARRDGDSGENQERRLDRRQERAARNGLVAIARMARAARTEERVTDEDEAHRQDRRHQELRESVVEIAGVRHVSRRAHDGMAAFPAPEGKTILVRNHELDAYDTSKIEMIPSRISVTTPERPRSA